jgi:sugar lactone lactonase YvrE
VLAAVAISLLAAGPAAAVDRCGRDVEVRVLSSGHGILESIGIDSRGQLFFTDSSRGELLRLRKPGREPRVILDGIDGPGGIVFRRQSRRLLMGFGNTVSQAADGTEQPEAGLLSVNPRKRSARIHTRGLQMANGIARGPGPTLYASNDISGGVDRIRNRIPTLSWADLVSPNGMSVDRARESLFVNQTLTAARIERVPLADPGAFTTYYAAPAADAGAAFDGLARDRKDRLYVAANGPPGAEPGTVPSFCQRFLAFLTVGSCPITIRRTGSSPPKGAGHGVSTT